MQENGFSFPAVEHWHDDGLTILHESDVREHRRVENAVHGFLVIRGLFPKLADFILFANSVFVGQYGSSLEEFRGQEQRDN